MRGSSMHERVWASCAARQTHAVHTSAPSMGSVLILRMPEVVSARVEVAESDTHLRDVQEPTELSA